MPYYDYECSKCKKIWEEEQNIKDSVLTDCPHCKTKNSLKRLIGATSFVLQGGGWFSEGYSKK